VGLNSLKSLNLTNVYPNNNNNNNNNNKNNNKNNKVKSKPLELRSRVKRPNLTLASIDWAGLLWLIELPLILLYNIMSCPLSYVRTFPRLHLLQLWTLKNFFYNYFFWTFYHRFNPL
jgi:hypothetical protein